MTTQAAAELYEAQHRMEMEGKRNAVYNPKSLPLEQLPVIYGFNNGGSARFLHAVLIAEDGTYLGGHCCSAEGYMPYDLGILEGTRLDRHETFQEYYPGGYRMEFVSHADVKNHEALQKAIKIAEAAEADLRG